MEALKQEVQTVGDMKTHIGWDTVILRRQAQPDPGRIITVLYYQYFKRGGVNSVQVY